MSDWLSRNFFSDIILSYKRFLTSEFSLGSINMHSTYFLLNGLIFHPLSHIIISQLRFPFPKCWTLFKCFFLSTQTKNVWEVQKNLIYLLRIKTHHLLFIFFSINYSFRCWYMRLFNKMITHLRSSFFAKVSNMMQYCNFLWKTTSVITIIGKTWTSHRISEENCKIRIY